MISILAKMFLIIYLAWDYTTITSGTIITKVNGFFFGEALPLLLVGTIGTINIISMNWVKQAQLFLKIKY